MRPTLETFKQQERLRRRKLLDAMLIALAAVDLLMLMALLLTTPWGLAGDPQEVFLLWGGTLALLAGIGVIFVVSRRVSVSLAGALFVLLLIAISVISDEPRQVIGGRSLFVFTIPILAASVLLKPWASFVAAGISSLVIISIALGVFRSTPNVPAMLGFFVLATVAWLAARSLQRALATSHEVNEALRISQDALREYSERLEDMVAARTRELKAAQEQLVRREKMEALGSLAGVLGHELRNPLGVISNAVYYMSALESDPESKSKEYLDIISEEVDKAAQIIAALLDLASTRPPEKRAVNVAELIAYVMVERSPPEHIDVDLQVAGDLPAVYADPNQLRQVLGNLFVNAYEAMPERGQLTVTACQEDAQIRITVTDTGCGISPENMEKLFEPLFTTKARGIGVGLAVSKHLVEANSGTLEAQSEPGRGSTFTIRLPTVGTP